MVLQNTPPPTPRHLQQLHSFARDAITKHHRCVCLKQHKFSFTQLWKAKLGDKEREMIDSENIPLGLEMAILSSYSVPSVCAYVLASSSCGNTSHIGLVPTHFCHVML